MNIEEALKLYVDRQPPAGMEARILRRVHRPSWRWPALAVAAILCLAIAIPTPKETPKGTRGESRVARVVQPAPRSVIPPRPLTRHQRHKPDTIPALWRFAREHPETAIQLTETHEFEPIAPIEIEPLKIEESGVAP